MKWEQIEIRNHLEEAETQVNKWSGGLRDIVTAFENSLIRQERAAPLPAPETRAQCLNDHASP
jgi:hypothetical protein